jgi:predicted nucleotide-binding protein
MKTNQADQLTIYLADANEISSSSVEIRRWMNRVLAFLREAVGDDAAKRFMGLGSNELNVFDQFAIQRGHLEGLIANIASAAVPQYPGSLGQQEVEATPIVSGTRKVFVVHGHDNEVKESVARFLEKLELQPVILHEQPNQGRTVIEKFEVSSSDVAFAIVLLTPDDVGHAANVPTELRTRARQNVILELGYFLGRLGRSRVCALHRGGLELPSDFQGVVYIEFDGAGAWKTQLAQEFIEAKLTIKIEGLLSR